MHLLHEAGKPRIELNLEGRPVETNPHLVGSRRTLLGVEEGHERFFVLGEVVEDAAADDLASLGIFAQRYPIVTSKVVVDELRCSQNLVDTDGDIIRNGG